MDEDGHVIKVSAEKAYLELNAIDRREGPPPNISPLSHRKGFGTRLESRPPKGMIFYISAF